MIYWCWLLYSHVIIYVFNVFTHHIQYKRQYNADGHIDGPDGYIFYVPTTIISPVYIIAIEECVSINSGNREHIIRVASLQICRQQCQEIGLTIIRKHKPTYVCTHSHTRRVYIETRLSIISHIDLSNPRYIMTKWHTRIYIYSISIIVTHICIYIYILYIVRAVRTLYSYNIIYYDVLQQRKETAIN